MNISRAVYLQTIQTQNTYYDKKSLEKFTLKVKRKYKVCADIPPIDVFSFYVLTTRKSSCPRSSLVVIKKSDWEKRNRRHLNFTSYISPTHIESLTHEEVIIKIQDRNNGFKFVAKLPDKKYKELKEKGYHYKNKLTPRQSDLFKLALSEESINKIIDDMGL